MEAMIIRELTNKKFKFLLFFKKQFLIVFTVALIVGIVAGLLVGYIDNSSSLGVVIGLSLFFGILSSLVTGTLIPYMFWKMHDDPAEASGPIATVIQDTLSVIIFFTIAQALL
jgi:magnesium transporter